MIVKLKLIISISIIWKIVIKIVINKWFIVIISVIRIGKFYNLDFNVYGNRVLLIIGICKICWLEWGWR